MPDELERNQVADDSAQNTQTDTQADFGAVLVEQRNSDTERERDKNQTSTDSQTDKQTEQSTEKKSILGNPLGLLHSFGDTVAKTAQEGIKAAEAYLPQMEIFSGAVKDQSKANKDAGVLKSAEAGQEKISGQLDNYFKFRDSKDSANGERQAPGEYKNEDGSSYEIDKNGDLTRLTTAPSEKHPAGETYKAGYNDKHEMVKLETPTGKTFTRTSPENEKGFAYWQSRDAAGSKSSFGTTSNDAFVGKLNLNSEGAQFMLGHDKRHPEQNTKWAGTMIEYGTDGSETRSSLTAEKGKTTGFDSSVKEADGSTVQAKSKLDENGKATLTGEREVKSADGDSKTIIKDGKVVERKENLLASEKMAEMARKLDGNDRLQNLDKATITKSGDSTHVSIDNYGARNQRSIRPGTVINGTKPDHTTVSKHLEFDLKHGKDGSVSLSNIDGMRGYGSALGPLGRRWHSGSSEVHDIRIQPGKDGHASLNTRSDRGWMHASHDQLTTDAKATVDAMTGKGAAIVDALHDYSNKATLDHVSKREFKLDFEPNQKMLDKAKENNLPVEIGKQISAKLSYDEGGMKMTDIKGITALGQNVTALKLEPGKGGEMSLKAEYTDPKTGEKGSIPIPMSQAAPLLAMMGQESLAPKRK